MVDVGVVFLGLVSFVSRFLCVIVIYFYIVGNIEYFFVFVS